MHAFETKESGMPKILGPVKFVQSLGPVNFGNKPVSQWLVAGATEFVATTLFALLGGSGAALSQDSGALEYGLVLTVLIYMTQSKCNPAVSLAVYLSNVTWFNTVLWLVETGAQFSGAIAGYAIMKNLLNSDELARRACFTTNLVPDLKAFGWEFFVAVTLVLTVLSTAVDARGAARYGSTAPIAIGLALYVAAQVAGVFTGGAGNPALYLGPNIGVGHCPQGLKKWYVYMGGHFLAAVTGFAVYGLHELIQLFVIEAVVLPGLGAKKAFQ